MKKSKQILALVIQELRSVSRTRYVIFSFVFLPLFMWGMQGAVQVFFAQEFDTEGETVFIMNLDEGNSTNNLGELLIERLHELTENNESQMYGMVLDETTFADETYDRMLQIVQDEGKTPTIVIPANFTEVFSAFNISSGSVIVPKVEVLVLPKDGFFGYTIESCVTEATSAAPFTVYTIDKVTWVERKTITFEGEEGAEDLLAGAGLVGFLSIMLAVMAPSAFVSSSFAGEREKRTLEGLLVLPMRRIDILFGKLLAGMVIVGVFSIMNLVGLGMFSLMLESAASESADVMTVEITMTMAVAVTLMMFLSSFVAIGIGISVASLAKDSRTAETAYMMVMLVPAMIVGMTAMFGGVPETWTWMYLIPWTHSIALLIKGMYPQTYASTALTGSITADLFLHFGCLLAYVLISLFVASKIFDREGIVK